MTVHCDPLVLIVEDEPMVAESLALLIADHGYRVEISENGRSALEAVVRCRPDLIVTDYDMPHMNGGELIRALKAQPALRDIPVLMTSGLPEETIRTQAHGYDAFFAKPLPRAEFLQLVDRLIARIPPDAATPITFPSVPV